MTPSGSLTTARSSRMKIMLRGVTFGGALLLVALTAGIVVLSARQWIADRAPLLARISYSVVATAALVTVYQMWFWNVLSFYFS